MCRRRLGRPRQYPTVPLCLQMAPATVLPMASMVRQFPLTRASRVIQSRLPLSIGPPLQVHACILFFFARLSDPLAEPRAAVGAHCYPLPVS